MDRGALWGAEAIAQRRLGHPTLSPRWDRGRVAPLYPLASNK